MKKRIFLLFLIIGCSPKQEKKTVEPLTTTKVMGVYTGVTPCADCEGIYTRIEFIDSITYIRSSKYLGKSSKAFLDMGQWAIKNDSMISISSHGKSNDYLYQGFGILMLGQDGKRIMGALADNFKLAKGEPEGRRDWSSKTAAGIDFVAQGNESYWDLEIDFDEAIHFSTIDGDSIHTNIPIPTFEGSATILKATTETDSISIKLSPVGCINDMTGLYSDYVTEIKLNNNSTVRGCGEFINDLYNLSGTWTLAEINKETARARDFSNGLPKLTLTAIDKKVNGNSGCNSISGTFLADAKGALKFGTLATTRMICPDKGEAAFLKALKSVTGYRMEGDKLVLVKGEEEAVSFISAN